MATALYHFSRAVQGTDPNSIRYNSSKYINYRERVGEIADVLDNVTNLGVLNSGSSGDRGLYPQLQAGTAAKMVSELPIDGVLALMTGNSIWIDQSRGGGFGLLSVDDLLYDEFLSYAVDYALAGDLVHGHRHGSDDIRGDAMYSTQVQMAVYTPPWWSFWGLSFSANMGHVTGVGDDWHMNKPIINNESGG